MILSSWIGCCHRVQGNRLFNCLESAILFVRPIKGPFYLPRLPGRSFLLYPILPRSIHLLTQFLSVWALPLLSFLALCLHIHPLFHYLYQLCSSWNEPPEERRTITKRPEIFQ